ncbi:hypothetical protein MTO96_030652 [Rhipicephalus appendiculatus]
MPSSASSKTQVVSSEPSTDDSTDDRGISIQSLSPVSSTTDDLDLSPVSSTSEDCGLSPVSSTEGEASDSHYVNVQGLDVSSEVHNSEFLALRSEVHADFYSRAPSADMTLCPNSYLQRSTYPDIPRKASVPPGTGILPMNAFLASGDNSNPWCCLELGPLTNAISTGAEDKKTRGDVETMHCELQSSKDNSSLQLDPTECQNTLHASINDTHFSSASGNYAMRDNDVAASLGISGSARSSANSEPCLSTRPEVNTFVQQPLLFTTYGDINHIKIANDDKKHSGAVMLPVTSATRTQESETSHANPTSWTSYVPLPERSSTENFMSPYIAAVWEEHALVRVRVGTGDVRVYDLRQELDLANLHQRKHVNNAGKHASAPESSKRKTRQSSQPEQNKRSKSSRATRSMTELPIVETDSKKCSDAPEVQDVHSNHEMRTLSKSASVKKETTCSHQIDDNDGSSATDTARQDFSYPHAAGRETCDETMTTNDVTSKEIPAVRVCTLELCDDFCAGASDKDPRMLSGLIANERLEVKDSE